MTDAIKTIEYKGYKIKVSYSEFPLNPLEEFDYYIGKIICWHSRYNIGHKHDYKSPEEFREQLAIEVDPIVEDKIDYWRNGIGFIKTRNECGFDLDRVFPLIDIKVQKLIDKTLDREVIMLPIYMYDHSGVTIRTAPFNCPWDSGQIGYIYVIKSEIRKEFKWGQVTKERYKKIEEILTNEVKEYNKYLTGEIYDYVIENSIGEVIDSCGGYYDMDHLKEDAKGIIDLLVWEEEIENRKQHELEIGNCVI